MKKCKNCGKNNVWERNGIAVSKWCVACRKMKKIEKEAKRKQTKKYQHKETKRLKRRAWALMSRFVRLKHSDKKGMVKCYTCPIKKHYKEMQCGHFHHNKLDYDERNLRPQCEQCNLYRSGNLNIYATNLAQEIGAKGMAKLLLDANAKGNNYTILELESIIKTLKNQLSKW